MTPIAADTVSPAGLIVGVDLSLERERGAWVGALNSSDRKTAIAHIDDLLDQRSALMTLRDKPIT